eukprot:gene19263-19656_t
MSWIIATRLFFPKKETKKEREIAKMRTYLAEKEEIWKVVLWKKANFVWVTLVVTIISTLLIEVSYWSLFGPNIYIVIIMMVIIGTYINNGVQYLLQDAILVSPVSAGFTFATALVTFAAKKSDDIVQDDKVTRKREVDDVQDNGASHESVEPIIDYFNGVCGDSMTMYYFPYFVYLLMQYRLEIVLPVSYGIRHGMVYVMLAFQCWLRNSAYNPFSDPALFIILIYLLVCYYVLEWVIYYLAVWLKVWKIKHENTAWHIIKKEEDEWDLPGWEDVKGASTEAFLMNQRITSETFRYKFLNYNRTWLINQLPQLLTPRTMRRSRPYLINQFARIINARRDDISDDSDKDKDKKFVDIDKMAEMYDRAYPGDEEVDQVQWKSFWMNNQRYHTICLACLTKRKEAAARAAVQSSVLGFDPSIFDDGQEDYPDWGPVYLTAASKAMLLNWYRKAHDDEEDDLPFSWLKEMPNITPSTNAIAVKWMRSARARLQKKRGKGTSIRESDVAAEVEAPETFKAHDQMVIVTSIVR